MTISRPQSTATADVSNSRRHLRWLPLLAAAAVIALTSFFLMRPHIVGEHQSPEAVSTQTAHKVDFSVYRGHRWYLLGPSSETTRGYIDLSTTGEITVWNTQQQFLGSYAITDAGELDVHWTATSSGMSFFDESVVEAMSKFGDVAMLIRSTTPDTLVIEIFGGDRLVFSKGK